jgi:hypothetical protein
MLRIKTLSLSLLAVALCACGASRSPVPVVGPSTDISAMVGEWVGDYSSTQTGRSGSISFSLRSAEDTAFGDVIMIPTGLGRPLQPWQQPNVPSGVAAAAPHASVLTIRFVRVQAGHVSGTLDPYADPQTGERLLTTFAGDVSGNTISGTYTTRLPSGETQTGRWSVQRR